MQSIRTKAVCTGALSKEQQMVPEQLLQHPQQMTRTARYVVDFCVDQAARLVLLYSAGGPLMAPAGSTVGVMGQPTTDVIRLKLVCSILHRTYQMMGYRCMYRNICGASVAEQGLVDGQGAVAMDLRSTPGAAGRQLHLDDAGDRMYMYLFLPHMITSPG